MYMRADWSYDGVKRFDKQGNRWHFVRRNFEDETIREDERPYELYFRNDERSEFGLLRFEKVKDNSYRDYQSVVKKIMNNPPFRRSLLAPDTRDLWQKNWK